jgi:hypothetical protein
LHLLAPKRLRDSSIKEEWREFFVRLSQMLDAVVESEDQTAIKLLAERCMRRMHVLDTTSTWGLIAEEDTHNNEYYMYWLCSPKRKDSIFDDDLVKALIDMNPQAAPYWDTLRGRKRAGPVEGLPSEPSPPGPSSPTITSIQSNSEYNQRGSESPDCVPGIDPGAASLDFPSPHR